MILTSEFGIDSMPCI